jgi:Ferritin-like domain
MRLDRRPASFTFKRLRLRITSSRRGYLDRAWRQKDVFWSAAAVIEIVLDGGSRRRFLLGGLVGGAAFAGVVAALGRPAGAQSPSPEQDERILNFLLNLEYLQSAFYAEANSQGELSGELAEFARVVGEQERRHVERLKGLLGDGADPEPELDLEDVTSDEGAFLDAAIVLEDTGVSACIGQGSNLTVEGVAAVAPLVSVEARHAAWILAIAGRDPAPAPADPAASVEGVRSALERAGLTQPSG